MDNNTTVGVIGTTGPGQDAAPSGVVTLAELEAWVAALETYDTSSIYGVSFPEYDGVTDAAGDGVPDNYAYWATSDQAMPQGSPPSTDTHVLTYAGGNPIDIGAYLSVFAGYARIYNDLATLADPTLGYYHDVSGAAYAGRMSINPSYIGLTNKIINGLQESRKISKGQANRLAHHRFVCLLDRSGTPRVSIAVTGAYNINRYYKSDFTMLSTVLVLHDIIDIVRETSDPFISLPNTALNRNSLYAALDSKFSEYSKDAEVFNRPPYFTIVSTPVQQTIGEITVNVQLDIAGEIKDIIANIALVPPVTPTDAQIAATN